MPGYWIRAAALRVTCGECLGLAAVEMVAVGLAMGLAVGISPGPLMVLVVTQTLSSGWRAGLLTAVAPLVTDVVVVLGVLLALDALPTRALPVLGVVGGGYVIWSGIESWRGASAGRVAAGDDVGSAFRALRRASAVNLLSPHPWLTWATALGPLVVSTWRTSSAGAIVLVVGFYASLVGVKAVVALLVAGGRDRLTDAGYRRAVRVGAVLLVVAGLALIAEFLPPLVPPVMDLWP